MPNAPQAFLLTPAASAPTPRCWMPIGPWTNHPDFASTVPLTRAPAWTNGLVTHAGQIVAESVVMHAEAAEPGIIRQAVAGPFGRGGPDRGSR